MYTILVVDDEPDIRELIRFSLEGQDFQVLEAGHADEARRHLANSEPDLMLLDWMLPGRSGIELAQELKQNSKFRDLPIIMLTAKADEQDRVRGLDIGADDYVTKPFSPRELISRIRAVLRRIQPSEENAELQVAGLCLNPVSHRVTAHGVPLEIAPTEYRLLHFLMSHPDRAFGRSQLLDQVWGRQVYVEERTVDVHIRRLRKLLESTGHQQLIQTVRGVGYRFSEKP